MFVLSFKNDHNDPTRYSFDEYYISVEEIKDFNVLIDNKLFFEQPVKNKQESSEKLIQKLRNNDYTTGNLKSFIKSHQTSDNKSYYQIRLCLNKLILKGNWKKMTVQQCFFFSEKKQKTILNFSLDSLIVTE